MLQVIIPYIPQLAQLPSSMPLAAPLVPIRVTPLLESQPLAAQPPEEPPQPRSKLDHTPPRDVVRRLTSTPSTSARSVPNPDTLSSDSVDSLRVQLHKPIPQHFRLRMLEAHDGGSDPIEHVTTFRAQMTLYDMSDAIMCWAFPMTLCWIAQGWYIRLPPALIHSFDQLVREFEANFLTSARPKPIVASLLRMRQKEDEPLNPYLARFTKEIRVIPDAHPANQYVAAEALVVEKREDQKRPQAESPQGPLPELPRKRIERAEQAVPWFPNIPFNSTRTEIFL
ncbi:hypothetical protein BHM03_00031720 [Ensete ventricosum]|uniref:Retrotransposon gag domain-containing protein n=1 Tax=Ensete ventricosum TaxID=4639 RepID=A0A445MIP3_ENSVE|nr:hypothetical protein BHM03_00031720 [Ensete ventricosum]